MSSGISVHGKDVLAKYPSINRNNSQALDLVLYARLLDPTKPHAGRASFTLYDKDGNAVQTASQSGKSFLTLKPILILTGAETSADNGSDSETINWLVGPDKFINIGSSIKSGFKLEAHGIFSMEILCQSSDSGPSPYNVGAVQGGGGFNTGLSALRVYESN